MDWLAETLRNSLGNVTAVLLAGVLIGQLNITISPHVKSVFFLMFLFAVGYGVGPQFVRGLKSDGVPQAIFAGVLCIAVLLSTFVAAKLAGYNAGLAAGLLSGAATISAVLGVATDTINGLGLPPEQAKAWTDFMPVAYAVTYLFGTAGSAWFLSSIGPRLLGVDLEEECKEYEAKMGGLPQEAGIMSAYQRVALRAYRVVASSRFVGRREVGIGLVIGGAVVTLTPLVAGLYFGRYVLRMNPLLLLGALAGAQTMTAGLAAVQDKSGSASAVLGYTGAVPFGHILLTTWGTVIVWLMAP